MISPIFTCSIACRLMVISTFTHSLLRVESVNVPRTMVALIHGIVGNHSWHPPIPSDASILIHPLYLQPYTINTNPTRNTNPTHVHTPYPHRYIHSHPFQTYINTKICIHLHTHTPIYIYPFIHLYACSFLPPQYAFIQSAIFIDFLPRIHIYSLLTHTELYWLWVFRLYAIYKIN